MGKIKNTSYGNKLKFLRMQSGKQQNELAKHLGITQQAYSKLEKGDLNFTDNI
jgi:DNA-binding XRE family transcriptional regulator